MTIHLFGSAERHKIETSICRIINAETTLVSVRNQVSPRAAGDAIQDLISQHVVEIVGENHCKTYNDRFARRAMADVAFTDSQDFYHVVDIKTHRLETKFNMPNLTSVERLARFYEDDKNVFSLMMIDYDMSGDKLIAHRAHFVPIEYLDWSCLTIGALGWGQIQIANANTIVVNEKQTRKAWMLALCDTMLSFYPKEIGKIHERLAHFESVRRRWMEKNE